MAEIYAELIRLGHKKVEDVPERIRNEVQSLLAK